MGCRGTWAGRRLGQPTGLGVELIAWADRAEAVERRHDSSSAADLAPIAHIDRHKFANFERSACLLDLRHERGVVIAPLVRRIGGLVFVLLNQRVLGLVVELRILRCTTYASINECLAHRCACLLAGHACVRTKLRHPGSDLVF